MEGRVFLVCGKERAELFRDVLEGSFFVAAYRAEGRDLPSAGDAVLVDCVEQGGDWRGYVAGVRRELGEGARLVCVLRYDQMRTLDGSVPLDDFVADGSTGEEIRARLRRQVAVRVAVRGAAGLEIDEDRYEVRVNGLPVELTYKEFELLRFLASRPGRVFTREMLLEQVWGYDYFGGSRTVDVHVRRIRAKIEREGHTYIRTVRGVGYIFEHLPPR